MSDDDRKVTMPDMAVLGELVKLNLKFDDLRQTQANDSLAIRQELSETRGRLTALESTSGKTTETARRAMKSASDLSEHVAATEEGMKKAFEKVGERVAGIDARVDDMAKEQTPLLREIRDEQIARREREKVAAEQRAEHEADRTHRFKVTRLWIAAIVAIAGVALPLLGSYYGSKQANQDAPPRALASPSAAH